jgi:bifunctional polynucleotide phosphatase/kinase
MRTFDPTVFLKERGGDSTSARKFDVYYCTNNKIIQLLILILAFEFTKAETPEIVLFCGCPGAGKSSFYWRHLQPLGYERVNQDILKTVSC